MLAKLLGPAWAISEYAWYPLLVFVATPYLLHSLGPEKYGYWMLLTATAGLGTALNVGTGAATIKQVSAGRGQTNSDDVENVVRTSLAIALIGGTLLAALIFISFWFAGDILFQKMGDSSLVLLTGTAAALLVWIEQIDNVFASAFKGAEQFGQHARIEMTSKTIQIFAVVLTVTIWESMAALYAVLVLAAVARLAAKAFVVNRFLIVSSLCPTLARMTDILHYAKWGWLQGVGGLLYGVADRLLVGSLLGSASLAYYSVASLLAQQTHALSAAGLSVFFPKVSRKLGSDANFSLWSITKLTVAGNFFASTALALGLLFFGRQILSLWLGDAEAMASAEVLWYLTLAYWLLAINVAPHFILLGIGRIRFVAISNLVAGVISLITMYMLAQIYGLAGIGVARIVYGAIILVNFLPLAEYLWRKHRNVAT